MSLTKLLTIHLAAIFLLVLATFFGQFMPEKRKTIFPIKGNITSLYSDEDWGGATSVKWINKAKKHWTCDLEKSEFAPVCGLAANLSPNNTPINLSRYNAISIQLKYTGEAPKLRIYLRNHNPAYSNMEDVDSFKFNSVNIPISEFSPKETIIKLSEFSVEDWWIAERDIPRELAHPELNSILTLGLDYPYPQVIGRHSIQIDKIELIGPLFPIEQYYFSLLLLWSSLFVIEAACILIHLQKRKAHNLQAVKCITSNIVHHNGARTSLTDTLSRNNLTFKINEIFSNDKSRENVSLFLFKVDHFQRIKDKRGKEAAANILLSLHSLISDALQENDTFARWGEEEFLILSTETDKNAALQLAERIRLSVANNTFEQEEPLKASVSIGGTAVIPSDDFGTVFMRAEQALYRAGSDGHNRVHWQDGQI